MDDRIAVILLLSQLLFQLTCMVDVFAVTYNIGVEVGKWADYEFTLEISPSAYNKPPKAVEDAKNIDYIRVVVKEVFDTTVKIEEIIYFKNGSSTSSFYIGDVKTGQGNLSLQIIAANLGKGDNIFESPDSPRINETRTMEYAGATRTVNRLILETVLLDNCTLLDFYFDKETGFLCEMSVLSVISKGNYSTTTFIRWKMIRTNLWLPSTSNLWILFFIVVLSVFFYFIFIRRFQKQHFKSYLGSFKRLRRTKKSNRQLSFLEELQ